VVETGPTQSNGSLSMVILLLLLSLYTSVLKNTDCTWRARKLFSARTGVRLVLFVRPSEPLMALAYFRPRCVGLMMILLLGRRMKICRDNVPRWKKHNCLVQAAFGFLRGPRVDRRASIDPVPRIASSLGGRRELCSGRQPK
jgi:hypothetical protein